MNKNPNCSLVSPYHPTVIGSSRIRCGSDPGAHEKPATIFVSFALDPPFPLRSNDATPRLHSIMSISPSSATGCTTLDAVAADAPPSTALFPAPPAPCALFPPPQ